MRPGERQQARGRPLPTLVDDDTSDAELERLRSDGRVVMRFSEFLEIAV